MAWTAGTTPATTPRTKTRMKPTIRSCGGRLKLGMTFDAGLATETSTQARPRPISPPRAEMTHDSMSTRTRTSSLVNPIALSTPNSSVRSRTAWLIVLPATSRMVKKTAPRTAIMIEPMSPICAAKLAANAPSGSVFVS